MYRGGPHKPPLESSELPTTGQNIWNKTPLLLQILGQVTKVLKMAQKTILIQTQK